MVVVMQLFPTDDDAPWHQIGTGVWRFKVAIPPKVPRTVDDAGSCHRDPHHLNSPHSQAQSTKQGQVDDQHDRDALPRKTGVDVSFNPVVWRAVPITVQGVLVFRFFAIQLSARQQNSFDTVHMGAVGVFCLLALRMVFAVDSGPLFGHLTGSEPQPQTEEMRRQWVQV